jgi:hypothetical protein
MKIEGQLVNVENLESKKNELADFGTEPVLVGRDGQRQGILGPLEREPNDVGSGRAEFFDKSIRCTRQLQLNSLH